ncbi:GNAT family N-acetyltransferase [Achromobacter xylosoxidans]
MTWRRSNVSSTTPTVITWRASAPRRDRCATITACASRRDRRRCWRTTPVSRPCWSWCAKRIACCSTMWRCHPAQRRGYGRALMQWAETIARQAGYPRIRLYTQEAMSENIAIYQRYGYVETHRAEEIGLKRVFMMKNLD